MNHAFLPRWTLWCVLSMLLAFLPVTLTKVGQVHAASKTKADPAQIANGIRQWTGYLAKQAASVKKTQLAKDNKRAVPFWDAVKRLSTASSQLERDLRAKRAGYLKPLGDARSALTSVRVTYHQSRAKDSGIDKALTNNDRGLTLLERHAGPSTAGKSAGKKLSAKQKRQLDAMKAKQKELQRKLKQVESKVGKNQAAMRAIRDIRSRSDHIYRSRDTAADFFAALLAARVTDGLLWGWHWWWGPWGGWIGPWCGGFVDIYYESVSVIDVDVTVLDAGIEIDDYALDAGLDQIELDAVDDELSRDDFELTDAELDSLDGEGLGQGADEGIDEGIGDTDVGDLQEPMQPLETEIPPEVDEHPTQEALPEPEPLPDMDTGLVTESLPEPEALPETEAIAEPMPIEDPGGMDMAPDDLGGFDGGGFDGGGMDFDGGGDF